MGYYMQFILTDDAPLRLGDIEAALKEADPAYALADVHEEPFEHGHLTHDGALYGDIEINQVDPKEDEEYEEFREDIMESGRPASKRKTVLNLLQQAKRRVVVQVLWQGRDTEATLQKIDPLWEWLFAHRKGLLHADGEGFYDGTGLILKVE